MRLKVYLPLALGVFFAATTGADLVARMMIADESFAFALRDHLYWAGAQLIGTVLLLAPFVAIALICARTEKQAQNRSAMTVFVVAMLTLFYFYFQGYQEAQYALLERKWTASALSVGLLPFFAGIPLVLAVYGAGALARKFDRRTAD